MTKRDKLYDELVAVYWKSDDAITGMYAIADFIIQREKAMLDEIEKPLKERKDRFFKMYNGGFGNDRLIAWECNDANKSIDEALSTINRIRGEK